MQNLKDDLAYYISGNIINHNITSSSKKIFHGIYSGDTDIKEKVEVVDKYIRAKNFATRDDALDVVIGALNGSGASNANLPRYFSRNIKDIWRHVEYCVKNNVSVFRDLPSEWPTSDQLASKGNTFAGDESRSNFSESAVVQTRYGSLVPANSRDGSGHISPRLLNTDRQRYRGATQSTPVEFPSLASLVRLGASISSHEIRSEIADRGMREIFARSINAFMNFCIEKDMKTGAYETEIDAIFGNLKSKCAPIHPDRLVEFMTDALDPSYSPAKRHTEIVKEIRAAGALVENLKLYALVKERRIKSQPLNEKSTLDADGERPNKLQAVSSEIESARVSERTRAFNVRSRSPSEIDSRD